MRTNDRKKTFRRILAGIMAVALMLPLAVTPSQAVDNDWSEAYEDFVMNQRFRDGDQEYYDSDDNDEDMAIAFGLRDLNSDETEESDCPELIVYNGAGTMLESCSYIYAFDDGDVEYLESIGSLFHSVGEVNYGLYISDVPAPEEYLNVPGLYHEFGWTGVVFGSYYDIVDDELIVTEVATWDHTQSDEPILTSNVDLLSIFAEQANRRKPFPMYTLEQIQDMGWPAFVAQYGYDVNDVDVNGDDDNDDNYDNDDNVGNDVSETLESIPWEEGFSWNGTSRFDKAEDGPLVIENDEETIGWFSKTVPVEPNSTYRFSAMVKVEGYLQGSEGPSGVTVGYGEPSDSCVYDTDYVTSDEWTKSEVLIQTGDQISITLRLSLGGYNGICVGKAYFKDVALEKVMSAEETNNHWNVLALAYKNVETADFKSSFSSEDIDIFKSTMRQLPEAFRQLSDGRIFLDRVDVFEIDAPIRSVSNDNGSLTFGPGNDIDFDQYLEGKDYQQIIVFAPLAEISDGWAGLGGTSYRCLDGRDIWICITNCILDREGKTYQVGEYEIDANIPLFMHEMLHCVESNSRERGHSDFAPLHDNRDYGFSDQSVDWLDWYEALMQDKIPVGRGFIEESFLVDHFYYFEQESYLIKNDSLVFQPEQQAHAIITSTNQRSDLISIDQESAKEGDIITVTVRRDPEGEYVLEELTVKGESGWTLELTAVDEDEFIFTMPDEAVTVEASFKREESFSIDPEKKNPIRISSAVHGSIRLSQDEAEPGELIAVTCTPEEGYQISSVSITDENGNSLYLSDDKNGTTYFSMPDGPVTVTAFFEAADISDTPSLRFTDVDRNQWYFQGINYVSERGMMNGTGEGKFSPDSSTTRAMIVTVLHRLEGEPHAARSDFRDLVIGSWYQTAVDWASEKGVVNGISEISFAPDLSVTREQLTTMLYRYAGLKGYDTQYHANLSTFIDAGSVSSYAKEALSWAVDAGLVQGMGNGVLNPGGNATRAQIATILMRFCENIIR